MADWPIILKGKTKDLYNFFRKKKRKCFFCEEVTTDCHLLQKNGIISQIADTNKKVMSLNFSLFEKNHFFFKEYPYNNDQLYTFEGFCNLHDKDIFKPIESKVPPNFNSYPIQLLFSLRALMNMIRNLTIDSEVKMALLDDKAFKEVTLLKQIGEHLNNVINTESWIVHVEQMLFDLREPRSKNFVFYTIELPKIDICCSQVYIYEDKDRALMNSLFYDKHDLSIFFVNVLTYHDKSVLIIGYPNSARDTCGGYVGLYPKVSQEEVLSLLNKLLLMPSNHSLPPSIWLCSTDFYKSKIRPREEQILNIMYKDYYHHFGRFSDENGLENLNKPIEVNLFDSP